MPGAEEWIRNPENMLMAVFGVSILILVMGGLLRSMVSSIIAVELLFILFYLAIWKDYSPEKSEPAVAAEAQEQKEEG